MKKYLICILLTSNLSIIYSQNLTVKYDYYYKKTDSPVIFEKTSELIITPNSSLFKIIMNSSTIPTIEKVADKGKKVTVINDNKPRLTFKNLKNNTLINNEKILLKEFIVNDSLNIFKWKLENQNTKTILGYNCNQASLKYRGRNYEAYYAPEIPIQNGPYKFHGLPGLILEIKTIDKSLDFKITATSLVKSENNIEITNPYKDDKQYTWQEYVTIYKKKYKDLIEYSGENGSVVSIPKGKIEIIIED